ncbi:uncharacterized protein LOC129762851 [Toxorhynchites rutilus septentrionalis]|uniref:uncharacterized protein LOC129762851 n=1 Tax=Toxorhynchites rutilus septentrionalis TaxID=329112 RepID=UPI0024786F07|nr:uncharacterized protein LOC129762851 [Toxorhynchites rutilus septentrionalis]
MSSDIANSFVGNWEIVESHIDGTTDRLGLEGVKFRLDEMGDIIWYNDLINTSQGRDDQKMASFESSFCPINDSAAVLFSCETFEVLELSSNGPGLIFGAYTGHSIEFKTNSYNPGDRMSLRCNGWCQLVCKRVKEDQSVGQEIPFTLLSVLDDGNFCDVTLKSCDNVIYNVHSPILRLNGFDCSSMAAASTYQHLTTRIETVTSVEKSHPPLMKVSSVPSAKSPKQSVQHISQRASPTTTNNFLLPPSLEVYNLSPKIVNNISNSFNCLTAEDSIFLDVPKKQHTSSSDSNLNSDRNIFFFPTANVVNPYPDPSQRSKFKPPSSPFRARSPSPFPCSLDTPPSSPLTPLSVLNNIPSKMLSTILHWLYCECLPEDLDEETCSSLIVMCESTTPLSRMAEPCKNYLRNIKLKKFVIDIVTDLHDSLNHMIQMVNPNTISHSPCVLCQVFKEGFKETLTAIVKLLQFCNIFTKDAATFTRHQRHEIIKYVRSRMPVFLSQVHQLLQNVNIVLRSLSADEKNDLVSYLVPEITYTLEVLIAAISEIKNSLEKVCKDLKTTPDVRSGAIVTPSATRGGRPPVRTRSRDSGEFCNNLCHGATGSSTTGESRFNQNSDNDLKFFLYMYEVKKMRDIHGRVSSALEVILHKRATFNEMNHLHQHQTIRRNLEQLTIEVPIIIARLEELCETIDEKIGWKEFKFCFKFLTSQVNGIITKLLEHKSALNDAMLYISNLVQKEQFTRAMRELGLLEDSNVDSSEFGDPRPCPNRYLDYSSTKLNLVQSMCEPPAALSSSLSKNALKLLHSGQLADMEFEVVVSPIDCQNENIVPAFDFSLDDALLLNGSVGTVCGTSPRSESHTFKAHRVIVAARCEWFKKALLSGMQEDINRKIVVHDTSPVIFRRLLLYLYGAPVDKSVGVDQICELMLLADRYSVDNLKDICENTLIASIDSESVICLLGISDRFNAAILKARCLSYVSQHMELTKLEIFNELPGYLKHEVEELINWRGRVPEPWCDRDQPRSDRSRRSLKSPSRSKSSRSRKTSPSFM